MNDLNTLTERSKLLLEFMDLGSLDKVNEKIKFKKPPCVPDAILSKDNSGKDYPFKLDNTRVLYPHKVKHSIHNMKPVNISINSDGLVKLTDFV
jgi:hypothetical protein